MKVGDKIKFGNGIFGEIIEIEHTYGLIRFLHGQFVFNLSKINENRVVKQNISGEQLTMFSN